jgi:cold shock CspA family protein
MLHETGTIDRYFTDRHFGFITSNGGEAFFHLRSIKPDALGRRLRYAKPGLAVTFSRRATGTALDITPVTLQELDLTRREISVCSDV